MTHCNRFFLHGLRSCIDHFNVSRQAMKRLNSSPLQGGLKMTLEQFTWPLGCGGLALAIFALTMYHRLVKWIGPIKLCRAGLLAGIIPCLLLPTASLFAGSKIVPLVRQLPHNPGYMHLKHTNHHQCPQILDIKMVQFYDCICRYVKALGLMMRSVADLKGLPVTRCRPVS